MRRLIAALYHAFFGLRVASRDIHVEDLIAMLAEAEAACNEANRNAIEAEDLLRESEDNLIRIRRRIDDYLASRADLGPEPPPQRRASDRPTLCRVQITAGEAVQ